ncbi:putative UV resistance protein [Pseudomonas cannabina pv. alisalensis]|uniref:UV resistance protein n=2 Tax=Pseudomonas cannabina TaxID=86840 RepID=A0A3M3QH65_PSECA|nr:putative UV resistance protein [Pseudomonas cannabina pv. alisalensis]RMN82991.1 putative UV resistance protein [Pseudomonas cannabina pv. alisalensis]RMN83577.1 putative UV resistance protein [Pseudomonas cannabina]RMO00785.1 putative UV resistance protein [Pseudomonas cannabina]
MRHGGYGAFATVSPRSNLSRARRRSTYTSGETPPPQTRTPKKSRSPAVVRMWPVPVLPCTVYLSSITRNAPMNLTSLRQITESELPTLLQVLSGRASGGFPNPAADHYEAPISLDDLVDLRAPHVWLGETEGDSMSPAGILNGTRLVIDRARTPQVGNVVVAYIDNQPVVICVSVASLQETCLHLRNQLGRTN